jgi:hypothetical protein
VSDFIFQKFFDQASKIEDLSGDQFGNAKAIEGMFTALVAEMKKPESIPLPNINKLMDLYWNLVGNKICPTAITDSVPSLSFWGEMKDLDSVAFILAPPNWLHQLCENPSMQLGALIFTASQARDYWNNLMPSEEKFMRQRAWAYESEFLHYWQEQNKDWKPNEYQANVMKEYPKGIDTDSSLQYQSRKYDGQGPPFPVDIEKFLKKPT